MITRHARSGLAAKQLGLLRSVSMRPRVEVFRCASLACTRPYVGAGAPRLWRRPEPSQRVNERRLATLIDDFRLESPENITGNLPYMPTAAQSPPDFYTFNNSMHPMATIPEPTHSSRQITRMNNSGIPGDVEDMLQVFDACMQVQRLDRASHVLKRLDTLGVLSYEQRISLHNQYLRASLVEMRTNPDRSRAERLHKWYELQINENDLPHTAETIACMLKASLLSVRGDRLRRLVKRYMGMAPGESGLRVLGMADILSDQDLAVITEICPTYNYSAETESEDFAEFASESAEIQGHVENAEAESVSRSLPELVATEQRGQGLLTLKQGLRLLSELQDVDMSKLTDADRQQIQLQLERDSIDAAINKWRADFQALQKMGVSTVAHGSSSPNSLSQVVAVWLVEMEARIKEEIAKVEISEGKTDKSREDLNRCLYGPIIRQADPARLAAVAILTTINLGSTLGANKGITVTRLINVISNTVQEDMQAQRKGAAQKNRKQRKVQFNAKSEAAPAEASATEEPQSPRIMSETMERDSPGDFAYQQTWSVRLKAQVATILISILIDVAKVNVTRVHQITKASIQQPQPAFTHRKLPRKGRMIGVVTLNQALVDKLKREPAGDFLAKHLPMIVEPKPWKRFHEGGLLDSKVNLVRLKPGQVEQKLYTDVAVQRGDLEQVFKGLDVLGQTAWQINSNLLAVMVEAWNSGEAFANMPPSHPDLSIPPEPEVSADPMARKKWARDVKLIENRRSSLHSQRCYMNLQLEIARTFRNQTLYFPHNVDYRGRAYPIPTYLNHMGADHTRAILRFAKGKELGERGLRWLKIHLANLYGLDKASFSDREAFAMEHLDQIIDSATNPLKGKRWWLSAEDPWQCLGACFELKAAMELPDPTKYVSHLPIHQDGTCNGLQHYAALGGDTWGAKQVNLEPGDKPADVYSAVADLVKEKIAADLAADNPFAKALEGKITRKVVKQTVMTNVYGVTFAGARKQVCKQIDALYPDIAKEFGFSSIILSTYVAKHIFTAMATLFRGAHDIQYWLGEVGGRVCRALTLTQLNEIAEAYSKEASESKKVKAAAKNKTFEELAKNFRSTIVWTTPLKLPVVQPYRKPAMKEVRTCIQNLVYPVQDQIDPVNRRKQLQAFPPNFIHSLDASHMLLSALKCKDLGLEFAAVHDSFWTHACDVDTMNGVIRDAFINIHEEDVVGRLATEFEARQQGSLYLAHIDSRSPVARKIQELRKKSQLSPLEELLLEHKRLLLRLSGNPWDLESAKKIITPASVYEEMNANEVDLDVRDEMKGIALGEIPEGEPLPVDGVTTQDVGVSPDETEEIDGGDDAFDQAQAPSDIDDLSPFERKLLKSQRTTSRAAPKILKVWLPLTIPPIPKKGDFDVTRLRNSQYFFS